VSKIRLTKKKVEAIKPSDKDIVVWDKALPGFGVRVKKSGVRSYIVQYRNRNSGDSQRMTLGQHGPRLTFHQARIRARLILADVTRGGDPIGDRRDARKAPTMQVLADDYLERHAVPKKRPNSIRNDRAMLENIILPKIGRKKVETVTRRDIESIHVAMRDRPYQANRVLALLSKMFNLAISWEWRTDNPTKGIERYHEDKRDRYLSDDELGRLCEALDRSPNQRAANAIRLQLLTGARLGEVLKAEWTDIDFDRGAWTKPSHHTKQNRTEYMPLSPQALTLLSAMREAADSESPFLFPGDAPGKPLQEIKKFWRAIMREAQIEQYRRHDNRHTFASHLVSGGLSLEIVGRLLGHTNPATTKRYAHLADDPLRAAASRFGGKMEGLRTGKEAEIVTMRPKS
jgi:integrase